VAAVDVNIASERYMPVGLAVPAKLNIKPLLKDLYYSGVGDKFTLQVTDVPGDKYETSARFYTSSTGEEYFTCRTWDVSIWNDYKELEYLLRTGIYIKSADAGVMRIHFGLGEPK
jgi:hypothetical protein